MRRRCHSLVTLVAMLGSLFTAKACGVSVHNELTFRSLHLFKPRDPIQNKYKNILLESKNYLQAGSFFPDWGYQCLGYHQQSEDAHWAPFIRTAIEYIKDTYPQSWDDPSIKGLVAFVFAIMSHDMADVKWHSLGGLSNYFIEAMAHMDFHDNTASAHTAADTGAEFALRHSTKLAYLNETWKIPIRDLVQIYTRLYKDSPSMIPSEGHLRYCMSIAFAAFKMDLKLGQHLFGYYGSKSPFLIEELNDYHKGGLQDMTASITECYQDMIHLFEGGSVPTLCASYFDDHSTSIKEPNHLIPNVCIDNTCPEIHELYEENTGILTLSMKTGQNEMENVQDAEMGGKEELPDVVRFHGSSPVATKLEYQAQDEIFDPFVTSSNGATLQRFPGQCQWLSKHVGLGDSSTFLPPITLSLPILSAAVGHATATGDFDADGELDLAISAPYHDLRQPGATSVEESLMNGVVFILNGTKTRLSRLIQEQHINITDIRDESQVILTGHSGKGRFGWSMATVDLNCDGIDDLAVASPFSNDLSGHVDVFFGRANAGHGLSEVPDIRIQLPSMVNRMEGFGAQLAGVDIDGDGHKDLIVGCPYCSVMNEVQAGALYIFLGRSEFQVQKPAILTRPDWILASPNVMGFEHFGSAFEFIDYHDEPSGERRRGILLVGAPDSRVHDLQRAGRVYCFELFASIRPQWRWTMSGVNEFQQFGRVIITGKSGTSQQYIAISSPSETTWNSRMQRRWQGGVVRIYGREALLNIQYMSGEISLEKGMLRQLNGNEIAGHLGASMAFFERDSGGVGLWIGEPMGDKERGRVYRWNFENDEIECIKNLPTLVS
ncbi:uncharacterized protein BYT42DRAFT_561146 [Radiomyces spectabilis]|uniref:uncharacterized protein n=1 Tax=Radiomyces spectabilis TaxID=64574 RepID=UPI00221FD11E|nr:uncharacterized protein BYT42DRAFT_561146 [Radiomyces spectabilis]KAI8388764.1 hypothetical protein BYT42DRAFT_561146 [Radiomyces spectabilis]